MGTVGYCWPQSVVAGEDVDLHLSGDGTTPLTVEVVRDGLEPTVVWRAEQTVVAPDQPMPPDAPEEGCIWAPTVLVPVGDWPSGLYLVRTTGPDGAEPDPPTAWFVVRPATATPGAPLLKLATNTWNAYNDVGGRNLYTGGVTVSPQRPLAFGFLAKEHAPGERVVDPVEQFLTYSVEHGLSLWHGMSGWAGQELRFVRWAERNGIELDVCIDADLDAEVHRDPAEALLRGRRLVLSLGHDEYWTWGMRDVVEGFVARGGNVAFLSGNTAYWQVRLEEDDRRMIAWKHRYQEDPVMGTDRADRVTSMWSDPLTGRPETAMTGVTFTRGGYHRVHLSAPRGAAGYEVHRHDHWLFDGTELRRGDLLGTEARVVGYECDGTELSIADGLPVPADPPTAGTPDGLTVLATAPATGFDEMTTPLPVDEGAEYELVFHAKRLLGDDSVEAQDRLRHGHAVMAAWTHAGGDDGGPGGASAARATGTVVTVGCTEWAYGLELDPSVDDGAPDPIVARITRNVLDRLG
ncbi:N,N-dimethylformamidase beta subunit family domain-containing protein [Dermatobacter hominis]|uniref:N,N-dimethylformamidase beta subunit family domain-containing protein n=1 Tax=Dermatobacter hominis TaxID=2884263 RepID=UPI001D11F7BF|nr:N,N-dimethylformamidase beta subunit family domain-containing protein [Dermatobacter hominis]UDY37986.1 hypothetical protein LH044_10675 [Dermatobacter hominis]